MSVSSRFLVASLVGFLLASPRVAQALDPSQSVIRYGRALWSQDRDSSAVGAVYALAQGDDGYLWLGTEQGLVRFDGIEFVQWSTRNPALPRRRVSSLMVARDGSLWIGFFGTGGVSRVRGNEVINFSVAQGLPLGYIRALFESRDGTILGGGQPGLFRFTESRWEKAGAAVGFADVTVLHEDGAGTLWVGTLNGTFRCAAGVRDCVRTELGAATDITGWGGSVWLVDGANGAHRMSSTPPRIDERLRDGRRALVDRDGNLWVGTAGRGLWRLTSIRGRVRAERLSVDESTEHEEIWDLVEDRDGNVWCGTDRGLLRLSDTDITMITSLDGLAGNVRALAATPDGRLWAGTTEQLAGLSDAGNGRYAVDVIAREPVMALHVDGRGRLWTAGPSGISVLEGRALQRLPLPPGTVWSRVPGTEWSRVYGLTTASDGAVWFCDYATGPRRWLNGVLENFASTAIAGQPCLSPVVDESGRVWLALRNGGVATYEDGRFQVFDEAQGFLASGTRVISVGRDGLWFATFDGLIRYSGGAFKSVIPWSRLPAEVRPALVEDAEGQVWVGIGSGVIRLNVRDGEEAPAFRVFGQPDGWSGSIAANIAGSPTAARSPDGRLWFATSDGIAMLDLTKVRRRSSRSSIPRVEAILADDVPLPVQATIDLRPGTSRLEFRYSALNLSGAQNVRFRYSLDGFDQSWIDAGVRRQAFYTNLPPREYTFRVAATDSDGQWVERVASQTFVLRPRFYQTGWFAAVCVLFVLSLVGGAWWLRLRVVEARFRSILAERTRLSREIHDTLLQNLGSVQLELEVVAAEMRSAPDSAMESLRRLRGRVTECIREARDSIWNLRTTTPHRQDVLAAMRDLAARVNAGGQVQCTLTISGTPRLLASDVQEQLLRIAEEAVRNAVRHGSPSRITIDLDYETSVIALRVADNGRGFEGDVTAATAPGHWGVVSMRERAATVGGSFTIASRAGSGTQVEAVIPAHAES